MVDFMEKMESGQEHHNTSIATGNRTSSRRNVAARSLPDDILIDILMRFSVKSLFRFKCVSKKWRSLISHEIFGRNPPLVMSGVILKCQPSDLVHEYACDIDGSFKKYGMDFFPYHKNSYIMDLCNGLVLWYSFHLSVFYVTELITKKSVVLPKRLMRSRMPVLDFDPSISSHFKVISLCGTKMEIFSSETGEWFVHKVELSVPIWMTTMCCLNGVVYAVAPPFHFVGINLDNGQSSKMELPVNYVDGRWQGLVLGKSRGFLRFVSRDRAQIKIWMLKQVEEKEWVLKCTISNETIAEILEEDVQTLSYLSICENFKFLAFHPQLEVVFFQVPGKLLSYHLEKKKVELISDLESEGVRLRHFCMFPFLGSMLN